MRQMILWGVGLLAMALVSCGGDYAAVTGPMLSIDRTSISLLTSRTDGVQITRVTLTVKNTVPDLIIFIERSSDGLENVEFEPAADGIAYLHLVFKAGSALPVGTYTDTVHVTICRESPCVRQIGGSPQTITTTYTVRPPGVEPEVGMAPLATASRNALPHNVIDAEYSKALNAVVMVSSWPSNALYVHDAVNGTEKKLLLNRLPTAVSVSPDGRTAAVGHDALVSHIELSMVGQAAAAATELTVSAVVGDLVLDGRGYAHVFPEADQWVQVHTINVASQTETLSPAWATYAGLRGRLHSGGNRIYAAHTQTSSYDIETYDVSGGVISTVIKDWSYLGDHDLCRNLWMKEDGSTIYSACGHAYRASVTPSLDRRYIGRMPISPMNTKSESYFIRSLSQSGSAGEIALIEEISTPCSQYQAPPYTCYSHLALHEDSSMNRLQVFTIPPIVIDNYGYLQRGLFVFHRNDNAKVLISRLIGGTDQGKEYYLSISN